MESISTRLWIAILHPHMWRSLKVSHKVKIYMLHNELYSFYHCQYSDIRFYWLCSMKWNRLYRRTFLYSGVHWREHPFKNRQRYFPQRSSFCTHLKGTAMPIQLQQKQWVLTAFTYFSGSRSSTEIFAALLIPRFRTMSDVVWRYQISTKQFCSKSSVCCNYKSNFLQVCEYHISIL